MLTPPSDENGAVMMIDPLADAVEKVALMIPPELLRFPTFTPNPIAEISLKLSDDVAAGSACNVKFFSLLEEMLIVTDAGKYP